MLVKVNVVWIDQLGRLQTTLAGKSSIIPMHQAILPREGSR